MTTPHNISSPGSNATPTKPAPDTTLTVRVNRELKTSAQAVFHDLGLDLSTAINIFLRQVVHRRSLPFSVTLDPTTPVNPATPITLVTTPVSAPASVPTLPNSVNAHPQNNFPQNTPTTPQQTAPNTKNTINDINNDPNLPQNTSPAPLTSDPSTSDSLPDPLTEESSGAARLLENSEEVPLGQPFPITRPH